jgi:hypothetical protein
VSDRVYFYFGSESQFPAGVGLCLLKESKHFPKENQGEVRNE